MWESKSKQPQQPGAGVAAAWILYLHFSEALIKMSSPARVCVVTGASYGLGSHIAKQLGRGFINSCPITTKYWLSILHILCISATKGWEIVLVARSKDKLDQVKNLLFLHCIKFWLLGEGRDWGGRRGCHGSELWHNKPGLCQQSKTRDRSKVYLVIFLISKL